MWVLLSQLLRPAHSVNSVTFRFHILWDKWIWNSSAWLKLLSEMTLPRGVVVGLGNHFFSAIQMEQQSRRAHLPQWPQGITMAHPRAAAHLCIKLLHRFCELLFLSVVVVRGSPSQGTNTRRRFFVWLLFLLFFLITQTCVCSCHSHWGSWSWHQGHAVSSPSKFSEDRSFCFSLSFLEQSLIAYHVSLWEKVETSLPLAVVVWESL